MKRPLQTMVRNNVEECAQGAACELYLSTRTNLYHRDDIGKRCRSKQGRVNEKRDDGISLERAVCDAKLLLTLPFMRFIAPPFSLPIFVISLVCALFTVPVSVNTSPHVYIGPWKEKKTQRGSTEGETKQCQWQAWHMIPWSRG